MNFIIMNFIFGLQKPKILLPRPRCHGEFGSPDLWHPHAREIGTPKQNTVYTAERIPVNQS